MSNIPPQEGSSFAPASSRSSFQHHIDAPHSLNLEELHPQGTVVIPETAAQGWDAYDELSDLYAASGHEHDGGNEVMHTSHNQVPAGHQSLGASQVAGRHQGSQAGEDTLEARPGRQLVRNAAIAETHAHAAVASPARGRHGTMCSSPQEHFSLRNDPSASGSGPGNSGNASSVTSSAAHNQRALDPGHLLSATSAKLALVPSSLGIDPSAASMHSPPPPQKPSGASFAGSMQHPTHSQTEVSHDSFRADRSQGSVDMVMAAGEVMGMAAADKLVSSAEFDSDSSGSSVVYELHGSVVSGQAASHLQPGSDALHESTSSLADVMGAESASSSAAEGRDDPSKGSHGMSSSNDGQAHAEAASSSNAEHAYAQRGQAQEQQTGQSPSVSYSGMSEAAWTGEGKPPTSSIDDQVTGRKPGSPIAHDPSHGVKLHHQPQSGSSGNGPKGEPSQNQPHSGAAEAATSAGEMRSQIALKGQIRESDQPGDERAPWDEDSPVSAESPMPHRSEDPLPQNGRPLGPTWGGQVSFTSGSHLSPLQAGLTSGRHSEEWANTPSHPGPWTAQSEAIYHTQAGHQTSHHGHSGAASGEPDQLHQTIGDADLMHDSDLVASWRDADHAAHHNIQAAAADSQGFGVGEEDDAASSALPERLQQSSMDHASMALQDGVANGGQPREAAGAAAGEGNGAQGPLGAALSSQEGGLQDAHADPGNEHLLGPEASPPHTWKNTLSDQVHNVCIAKLFGHASVRELQKARGATRPGVSMSVARNALRL